MTCDEIMAMPAGRELNELIAEKVMDWHKVEWHNCKGLFIWQTKDNENTGWDARCVPDENCNWFDPSDDIVAAWQVVEIMNQRDYVVRIWMPTKYNTSYTKGIYKSNEWPVTECTFWKQIVISTGERYYHQVCFEDSKEVNGKALSQKASLAICQAALLALLDEGKL